MKRLPQRVPVPGPGGGPTSSHAAEVVREHREPETAVRPCHRVKGDYSLEYLVVKLAGVKDRGVIETLSLTIGRTRD
jgi:hypothetical protein